MGLIEAGEKIRRKRNRKMDSKKRLREEVGTSIIVTEERENGNNMKQRKKTFENRKWERTIDRDRTNKRKRPVIWASSILLPLAYFQHVDPFLH